jgi:murein DD-endopeptidase MepM/ murein hydrolase activator NlpD
MITKKIEGQVFVWNPNAFNGKGYWFLLGKNGSYGRAASKNQASQLSRPNSTEISENSPEKTPEKEISGGTQSSLGKLKDKFNPKNISKMFKPLGNKITNKVTSKKDQSEILGKNIKPSSINEKKIGNVDTAFYSTISPQRIIPVRKKESVTNVAAKLLALFNTVYAEKKLQRELEKNFEEEILAEDKKRHDNLIKEIYKSKGMKGPTKGKKNKTADKLKDWSDLKNIQVKKGVSVIPIKRSGRMPTLPTIPPSPPNIPTKPSTSGPPVNVPSLPPGAVVTSRAGTQRSYETHQGVDVTVTNKPIYAVQDGTIIKSDWQDANNTNKGYGQHIIIKHDDGTTSSLYGHLSKLIAKEGSKVKAGDLIGVSGNTGSVRGSGGGYHLHFEYRENNKSNHEKTNSLVGAALTPVQSSEPSLAQENKNVDLIMFKGVDPEKTSGEFNKSASRLKKDSAFNVSTFESGRGEGITGDFKAKDGSVLYGFSLGGKTVINFAKKNPNLKFPVAYLVDPYKDTLYELLKNPPDNIGRLVVWYNPNLWYNVGRKNDLPKNPKITYIEKSGQHLDMPKIVEGELITDLASLNKNIPINVASSTKTSDELNNAISQNKNLLNNIKPVKYINNSTQTNELGKKASPRIIEAPRNQDYPAYMDLLTLK